jgi:hypothetical protein
VTRLSGLPHPSTVRARDQLQKPAAGSSDSEPLPDGTPGRSIAAHVGIQDRSDLLTFIVIGDHGGIVNSGPQEQVAAALAQVIDAADPIVVEFVYSVGDLVYFNGDPAQWSPQFYEPYANVRAPIVGIPGNHDGDSSDGVRGSGLASFMANLCASTPSPPPGDPDVEFGRHTQTQPYCDWTLELDAVTIVGVWSNVPSGGHLFPQQLTWLQGEIEEAATDRPLIVALHHPVYSVDAHHGGSAKMGAALDDAFVAAGRWPELVLSGHVHDYQRFIRTLHPGHVCTYVVSGNGGYHNLHPIAGDYQPGEDLGGGVSCEFADAANYGFVIVTVKAGKLSGEYVQVAKDGTVTRAADTFTI